MNVYNIVLKKNKGEGRGALCVNCIHFVHVPLNMLFLFPDNFQFLVTQLDLRIEEIVLTSPFFGKPTPRPTKH
jgi:hypothetical protein